MKKSICFFIVSMILSGFAYAQVSYNHKIDSIVNLVSLQSIIKMDKELSGDTIAMIGGIPQLIFSRYISSPGNVRAEQYIYEKFQSFGYSPQYMINNATNKNIYVVKTGTKYPNRKYIIGAHFDNTLMTTPDPKDTIYGADDNASGVSTMLEVARLVKNINFDYTVVFVAFDEEEISPYCNGSKAFVDSCYNRKDTLVGTLVLDNMAYDNDNDNVIDILPNSISKNLYYDFIYSNQIYQIGLNVIFNIYPQNMGDHQSFWGKGYKAILQFEHFPDFNPYNHMIGDTFDKLNLPFFHKNVKAVVALILSWGLDQCPNVFHTPVQSSSDTSARIASFEVHYPIPVGTGANAPRLYYKVGNNSYTVLNAVSQTGYNYNFLIPGFPKGSQITYYFALQDSTGTYVITSPAGGTGINPPGTTPPTNPYVYYIYSSAGYFSSGVPKPIYDMTYTYDTINVPIQGIVTDIKVTLNLNHTNDGDLFISILSPGYSSTLSQFAGQNGQNFTGTIFDDTASLSISQGTPPFTGRFRPSGSLTGSFNGRQMNGNWILKIYDIKAGNQGTLLNWNIQFKYSNPIGIKEINNTANDYKLYQNYPNPFNPTTNIKFSIPKNELVKLIIYDILGKEITTLVNERLQSGTYEIPFTINQLSSGIYIYKLEAGDFMEVKKMVIVK